MSNSNQQTKAELVLPSKNLSDDINFFTKIIGMRLDEIFPADDPSVAVISGFGLRLRIDKGSDEPVGTIRILTDDITRFSAAGKYLVAPNGVKIQLVENNSPLIMPKTNHDFVVRRLSDQAPWVIGRAGMHYRDLIPSRLGGSIIASHIRIPDGGPVPDMVHYHTVGFQLIFCYKGWVDLVYEDQGKPFRLNEGCCVIQPPQIRHRVLFASNDIEVIEIGVPAEHVTTIDHEMSLPNDTINRQREFQGQKFVHHKVEDAVWEPFRLSQFKSRDTTIAENTKNVAGVKVAKFTGGGDVWSSHDTDILFNFVMSGHMTLEGEGEKSNDLEPGDAFVIPPNMKTKYTSCSKDLELLEVSLPGIFNTTNV